MKAQQATQIKWTKGHKMTVRDWLNACQYSQNTQLQNLYHALVYGLETGRLPNWQCNEHDRFFTKNSQRMSNVQVREALARAAKSQKELTIAAALKALQTEFGLVAK